MLKFILSGLIFWRLALLTSAWLATFFIPKIPTFIGSIPWANFDGIHYLSIAENYYHISQQAFFPLFPLLIRIVSSLFGLNYVWSAVLVVHIALFTALVVLWKLISFDYNKTLAKRTIIALLIFPTSFFFGSIYTESLFLLFILSSFYFVRKDKLRIAAVLGFFAAMTRVVGIFLLPALLWELWDKNKLKLSNKNLLWLSLIPLGTLFYMIYLQKTVGDPLAFIHTQPAFGANRSGGEIILLPQVIIRYVRIFFTVPFKEYSFWIAFLEFLSFFFALGSLIFAWKKIRIRKSYIIFSLFSLFVPTLSGTFSSMPRYILILFPIFILLAHVENALSILAIAFVSIVLLIILTMFFVQGYFIA